MRSSSIREPSPWAASPSGASPSLVTVTSSERPDRPSATAISPAWAWLTALPIASPATATTASAAWGSTASRSRASSVIAESMRHTPRHTRRISSSAPGTSGGSGSTLSASRASMSRRLVSSAIARRSLVDAPSPSARVSSMAPAVSAARIGPWTARESRCRSAHSLLFIRASCQASSSLPRSIWRRMSSCATDTVRMTATRKVTAAMGSMNCARVSGVIAGRVALPAIA